MLQGYAQRVVERLHALARWFNTVGVSEPLQPRKQRARAIDVARLAGVSQSAVSRTFTPGASVSPLLKAKVLKTAKSLGYRPNAMARAVNTRRSNVYGIIIATDTTLQYPEVLAELSRAISAHGKRLMLFTLDSMAQVGEVVDQIWSYQVDGVVALVGLGDDLVAQFHEHGVPIVLYNRTAAARMLASSVVCDQAGCGHELASRLLALGHRHFGLIDGPEASTVAAERLRGAEAAIAAGGGTVVGRQRGDYSYESGRSSMVALLRTRKRPTAVIAASDMMALGAMDEARIGAGLGIPDDLSVAGFDGIGAARWASFDLATMRQPVRRMAEAVVAMLGERLDDSSMLTESRVLPGIFVAGSSIGAA